MECNADVLAIIPARGGSKGIKNKNIVNLNGFPLIAYSIEAALRAQNITRIICCVIYSNSPINITLKNISH